MFGLSKQSNSLANPSGSVWSQVVAFFKFENNYTDSKGNLTLTPYGSTSLSTTQKKWGSYSLYNGVAKTNANYAEIATGGGASNLLLGLNDYTVEGWVFIPSTSYPVGGNNWGVLTITNSAIFMISPGAGSNYSTTRQLAMWNGTTLDVGNIRFNYNNWHHICWTRRSGTVYFGVDGVMEQIRTGDTYFNPTSFGSGPTGPKIAADNFSDESMWGYLDSLRIINGQAIYYGTSYTVPTADFPTS